MTELNPLVSVIVPAYNSELYIKKTIDSILNQSYENIQIIVVDDGSEDNTQNFSKELLKNFENKKILNQKNSGVSSARNLGIDNADGEYICFLDSDDYYDRDFILEMTKSMLYKNLDLCYCGFREEVEGRLKPYKYNFIENIMSGNDLVKLHLNKETYLWTCSVIYRKKIIQQNNLKYIESCSYGEDQNFILKYLLCSNKVGCVKTELVNYVYRKTSATYTFKESRFTGIHAFENIKEYTKTNEQINKRIAEELYWIAISYSLSSERTINSKELKILINKYNYANYFKKYRNLLSYKERYKIMLFTNAPTLLYILTKIKTKSKKLIKLIIKK